jgi:hypothetical protein
VIFPIGRRVLLFTEITVGRGSAACGRTIGRLQEPGTSKILAWARSGGSQWHWGNDLHELSANDRLAVAATRSGLARLLRVTRSAPGAPTAQVTTPAAPSRSGTTSADR